MYYKEHRSVTLKLPAHVVGQIQCIVDHFDTEVSWYGDIDVEGDVYTIKNIYLFPQVVTGGTFRTDTPQVTDLYDAWYESKLNEMADHFDKTGESVAIMQYNGHSHVRAHCSPSGEDMKFRRSRSGINIYSIQNKQGEAEWEIWTDDLVFESDDIDIIYVDDVFIVADDFVLKPPATKTWQSGVVTHTPPAPAKKNQTACTIVEPHLLTDEERQREEEELWLQECEKYGYGGYSGYGYGYTSDGIRV